MKKKILVVDDNRVMLNFMTNLLEKEGHEVVVANDGISALDAVTSFTPDIVFIDLILPRIDGDLLCRIIRKMEQMKDCYLAILSGAMAEIGIDIAAIGADTCIVKGPFSQIKQNVLSTIQEAGRPKKDQRPNQILGLEGVHPRQMTKELISRKRHLETMLESIAEGVLEIASGRIVYANSSAVSITGLPLEQLLNLRPLNIFDEAERPRVSEILDSKSEAPLEIGLRMPLELNNRLVTLKVVPVKEAPSNKILLITDVTSRTRMEIELQHARKMEAIGTIAGGVSHNFRNTLASILANSQIIQLSYRNDEQLTQIIDRICSSVHRGKQLVNRLLEFSHKEIERVFKPVDLAALIQTTAQLMRGTSDPRIKIHMRVPDSLYILGDHSGLSSVLMNLCNNAGKAMPEGGTLSITAERSGSEAVVTISDTGHGMDAETLAKCFDPFFTTREIGKGTGLGLSTAYGIVKNHHGTIRATSRPHAGSTFKIVFPLIPAAEEKAGVRAAENDHGRVSKFDGHKGKRILVVDDEPALLTALAQLLEKLGCETMPARNGIEAIGMYRASRPDFVLMDISMPEMDGITCARKIFEYDPHASIVIISGWGPHGRFGIKEADRNLFKGYLTKPIDLSDLRRLLSQLYG